MAYKYNDVKMENDSLYMQELRVVIYSMYQITHTVARWVIAFFTDYGHVLCIILFEIDFI